MAEPRKSYELVTDETDEGKGALAILATVREKHKGDQLRGARVGVAWMLEKKPNADGRLILGRLKLCNELDRLLHGFQALVLINHDAWGFFSDPQRRALVHHELCHLAPMVDPLTGEQKVDGHGDPRWRVVKHDLEEFREVVAAHGCYKEDLRDFVRAAVAKDPNLDLFDQKRPLSIVGRGKR